MKTIYELQKRKKVDEIIDIIKYSKNDAVRARAVEVLAYMDDEKAIKELLNIAISEEKEMVRNSAIRAIAWSNLKILKMFLEKLESKKIKINSMLVNRLIEALRSSNKDIKVYAAIALGRIGDLRALPYLIDVLEDSSAEVRRASALALGMLRNNAAVNALMKRLDDEDVEVRKAALEALNDLNFNLRVGDIDKIAKCLNDAEPRVRELATIVLEKGGDNAIEPLLKALKDEVREVRVTALQSILACLAKSKRGEELRKKINEKISGDLADVVLETLEKTQNKAIRKNAIWLLGQISSSRGADPLLKILESGDKDERIIAATALVKIPNVIGKLCELTKHRDEEVRRLVCWISGMIGDERAKEVLNFALNDSSESVRRAAFQAISRVEKFKNYIQ